VSRLTASRARRTALVTTLVAVLMLAALAVAGTRPISVRRFTLEVPNVSAVDIVTPHASSCEGPVSSPHAFDQVAIWGASVLPTNRLRVEIRDASDGTTLSTGSIVATTRPSEHDASLDAPVPGGRAVRVCLVSTLNSFSVLGGPTPDPAIIMTHANAPGVVYSLAFLQRHQTLLGSLSTGFDRASLFRPTWVGSWTFWLLLALVLCGFGLAAVAVARAAADDDDGPAAAGDTGQSRSSDSTSRQ
jgi:hypothetical protein